MKKALFLLCLLSIVLQIEAAVYKMDNDDFSNVVTKSGFSYSSKKYNSISSITTTYYYAPTFPFEAFPSLKIKGNENSYLKVTEYGGYNSLGLLEIDSNSSGQFVVSTDDGYIARIEIEYDNGDSDRPLIDGSLGAISNGSISSFSIMSKDGMWKSITISSDNKGSSGLTIWGINVYICDVSQGGIHYGFDSANKNYFQVIRCDSSVVDANILSSIDYQSTNYPVQEIADNAFSKCSNLKSVKMPSSIQKIGKGSFRDCESLTKVLLPKAIEAIGNEAFAGCKNLSCVTDSAINPQAINANVFDSQTYKGTLLVPKESIALYKSKTGWANFHKIAAIEGPDCDFVINGIYYKIVDLSKFTCKVSYDNPYYHSYVQENITIPESVVYNGRTFTVVGIDNNAFNGSSNLTRISLPKSIQFVGKNAFDGCTSLQQIELPNTVATMEANFAELPIKKVVLFGDGETLPNWFKSNKNLTAIELNCTNLKYVSESAFENCQSLTTVLLPNTVTALGKLAFKGCTQISAFTFPTNLLEIPESAFSKCANLKEINFSKNITSIGKSAFSDCSSLKQLIITSSINNIDNNAFFGCSQISNLKIEDSKVPIQLGNNVEGTLSVGLFSSCPLQDVYIGRNINGETPFSENKNIEAIHIGHLVNNFPDSTLGNSPKLKSLKLGKSLTSMPSFNTCANLEFLEIGARLTAIPSFSNCASIRTIRLHSAKPQLVEEEFTNKVYIDCNLEVPVGTIQAYRTAPIWKNFFNLSEFEPEIIASQIEIQPSSVAIYPNETTQLNPIVLPLNANEVFAWESTNSDIVAVDAYGKITALKEGKAIISAKTVDGSNISAQCQVVVKPITFITEIIPDTDYISPTVGTNCNLNVAICPTDATYKNLSWSSSDDNIATVSNEGVVNAKNIGKCSIKIDATDGSNVNAFILVDVLPIYINRIEIQSDITSLPEGEQYQLNVGIEPENASIKDIKWEVSDSAVIAISDSGILTGLTPGKATAYAYTTDGSNLFATKEFEILPIVASNITARLGQDGLIDLQWSAKDYVKNVKDFNVYVSEDGGDFVLWLHNTTTTSGKFKGGEGKTYRFMVTMRNTENIIEKYDETKNAYIYVTK